jgi:ABC-type branched-subunit amino acid transport system substrate-binding protein
VALKGNLGALKRLVTVAEGEGSREYEASLRAAVNNSTTDLDTAGTGQAYDAVTALLMAYAAAPAPKKGADVAQLVPKQRFQGVTGPVEFDEVGDLVPHNGSFVKGTFTNKGKLVLGPFLPAPK